MRSIVAQRTRLQARTRIFFAPEARESPPLSSPLVDPPICRAAPISGGHHPLPTSDATKIPDEVGRQKNAGRFSIPCPIGPLSYPPSSVERPDNHAQAKTNRAGDEDATERPLV